ncbi:multiple C2 domain and transmembrane region protein 14 [Magnolia sinica]|uniref:multiple C2 domain and transmembrane region protein 14 n=1 Tax=Magnolia sinica TaxID=86752 RepID=UPI002659DD1C|nr:multiple C2 domain and transmembrane region protein 14 [Magnolia sinica]
MAETCSRKLVVEVSNAKNLMPKDGQGTSSAYVLVDFDGQRRRTKTKFRDLNPQWDEKLEFLVHDPDSLACETLELNIYNDKKTGKRSTFLGKVKISGSSFAKSGSEALVYYPLEKRSVFSQIKGELGLKVYYIDEEPPSDPNPDAPAATTDGGDAPKEEEKKKEEKPEEKTEEKKEEGKPAEAAAATPAAKEDKKPSENPKQGEKTLGPASEQAVEKPPIAAGEAKEEKEKSEIAKIPPDSGVNDVTVGTQRPLGSSDRAGGSYDLVERMLYLYVRVVKVKRTDKDTGSSAYAKMVIGTHSIRTRAVQHTDWDQVFAFHREDLNSSSLEVSVWTEKKDIHTDTVTDACMGTVSFDLQEVPKRVPPDSPLAPQWYTLEGQPENSSGNDVMLAVWVGTQADEAFQEAWQSDSGGLIVETRAKAYLSPKLWYLRLTVIQTQDLQLGSTPEPKARAPELYVKAHLGAQVFKTSRITISSSGSANPTWNEDLVFVAAEPFEPFLVIGVEDVSSGQSVGQAKVQVSSMDRRADDRTEPRSKWFNLIGDESRPYAGRVHVRACLEGGYHVLDEAVHVASDVRAAAKQLSKPPIGSLEVGIRGAANLLPMKTKDGARGTTDAYVVAKYGPKWFRTRTLLDRFNPRWNEQYTWDVYDPCTVLTIGIFDNGRYKRDEGGKPGKDVRIGKVRIRLSTLDINRVYLNSYALSALHPSGAKKMGEIELAVRFSCSSWLNLLQSYASPMLPRMHYVRPLGPAQQDILRQTAMRTVTARLARAEPPLGQEVVQYMLDSDTHVWSMRRSKANWFRVVGCLSCVVTLARWLDGVRTWAHPSTTLLVHMLLMAVVLCPHLILPTAFMYLFFIVVWRYRYRYRAPASIDPRLSYIDAVGPDELDEEFDTFPTTRGPDQIRMRYDRLRALAGRAQSLLGDMAAQGERVEALVNWRDPRATGIFVMFCLVASLVLYAVPFKALLLCLGFYYLRHPRFRDDMPSVPLNFFRRLPSLADRIL